MKKNLGFATKALHIGSEIDKETGAVIPPIYQTSTFAQKSPGEHQGYEYTRSHNPTRTRLENCLAALENAKKSIVTSSGLSATCLILELIKKGSNVLVGNDLYGGSFRLFDKIYAKNNLNFFYKDFSNLEKLEQDFNKYRPALVWFESISNPMMIFYHIEEIVRLAKKSNPDTLIVVDNTMLSPYLMNPLDLNVDIVMHSATKYINGHSDVIVGAIMLNSLDLYEKLFFFTKRNGTLSFPF